MSNHLAGDGKAPPPPPAPPLPPQRQGFVANALARVAQPFGYGSRQPSAIRHRPIDLRDPRLSVNRSSRWASRSLLRSLFILPKVPQVPQGSQEIKTDIELSLLSSRSTSHKTGIPIAALDISPDHTHAVLAGHNILKTIQVSDLTCTEDLNLRTSIIAYAATHEASGTAVVAKHKGQLWANDVKWSHGQYDSTIATAAANGQIVVYDINRTGVEIARLHEHSRQVHKLGFNPYKGQLMLSASQDGTARLWDLRDLAGDRSVMTCQSRRSFPGNSEAIRDIKWSPADGMEFALGTDNGVIQRWDFRNDKIPLLRVSAHENRSCYSIDWHPDGKHIASGGADKNIKVWDFSSSDRRKKHIWEIRAPQAIHNVCWRPPCWSSDRQSPSRWQCTQIATSYDQEDPRIHIWDFRRPLVPFRTFDRYETPATALLWHSEDLIWSVGAAGMFTQTDINFLPKTMDHRSPNTLDIAADGQILFFVQKRERRRTSLVDVLEDFHGQDQRRRNSGERQGSSEERSLTSSFKNWNRQHPASSRPATSSTGTPPSTASTGPVANLERSLQSINMHQFSQTAAIGYVEGLYDGEAFKYLARHYKIPVVPTEDVRCDLHLILSDALKANAEHAARAAKHRLSQSWLILAETTEEELRRRAEIGYQQRMRTTSAKQATNQENRLSASLSTQPLLGDIEDQRGDENASNMTTPLARPITDILTGSDPAPSSINPLPLSNAPWSKQPVKPVAGTSELAKLTVSDTVVENEHDPNPAKQDDAQPSPKHESQSPQNDRPLLPDASFVDMDRQMAERRAAMGNYRATPRPLLRLDDQIQVTAATSSATEFNRHDSNESFQLFSTSTDSFPHEQSIMGSFESNPFSRKSSSTPERANTVGASESYRTTEHGGSALVSDDEAQLRSQVLTPAPALETHDTTHKDVDTKSAISLGPDTTYRSSSPQKPIVHKEGWEDCVGPPEPIIEQAERDTANASHKYLLSDFIPRGERPEYARMWSASYLFEQLFDYHANRLHDGQVPTYLLLHLGRWLHHSISYERALLVISHYHGQLTNHELYIQAAELRQLALPDFPEIAEHGTYGITSGGPFCTTCQKARKGDRRDLCERCNQPCGECPICLNRGPISRPDSNGVSQIIDGPTATKALWTWCQTCGHGGHVQCCSVWWELSESEGACPTVGCACDCMPGARRAEIIGKLEKKREEMRPGVVATDEWKAPESAATQRARGLIGGKGPSPSSIGGGRGAFGLAAAGTIGKKVRIVVPDDESKDTTSKDLSGGKKSASTP